MDQSFPPPIACPVLSSQPPWQSEDLSLIIFALKIIDHTPPRTLPSIPRPYPIHSQYYLLHYNNFLQAMQNRISEMQNEEVDYLRFDRIKIQRKRMEHILEVIKDLSFKNKQLFKENAALKEERLHEGHYEKLYHEMTSERAVLLEKNMQISAQLEKYRSTVLHQEILINSLKQELYGENTSVYRSYLYDVKQNLSDEKEMNLVIEEYKILQEQYDQLKKEYSRLYRSSLNGKKSHEKSVEKHRHIGKQNDSARQEDRYSHSKGNSSKIVHNEHAQISQLNESQNWAKLKQKYDKCKKARKELSSEVKALRQVLADSQQRQKRHIQLIELLKQKRTKICECHINKLKKRLSQTTIEGIKPLHH